MKRLAVVLFVLCCGIAAGELPSSGYARATWTNPSSNVSGFTGVIDLSRMPSEWWDAANSSLGSQGRVANNETGAELASDWIDFDPVNETGLVRFYWGTVQSSTTQKVRIYPPRTGMTAYLPSNPYGSDNAYDEYWEGYWPLVSDFNDRTANGNDGTGYGGITAGGATGQLGDATEFDGTNDYVDIGPVVTSVPVTFMAWGRLDDVETDANAAISVSDKDTSDDRYILYFNRFDEEHRYVSSFCVDNGEFIFAENTNVTLNNNTWYFGAGTIDGTDVNVYVDDTSVVTESTAHSIQDIDAGRIGSRSDSLGGALANGRLQHIHAHSTDRAGGWIGLEHEQTDDQAAFWGTLEWVSELTRLRTNSGVAGAMIF